MKSGSALAQSAEWFPWKFRTFAKNYPPVFLQSFLSTRTEWSRNSCLTGGYSKRFAKKATKMGWSQKTSFLQTYSATCSCLKRLCALSWPLTKSLTSQCTCCQKKSEIFVFRAETRRSNSWRPLCSKKYRCFRMLRRLKRLKLTQ